MVTIHICRCHTYWFKQLLITNIPPKFQKSTKNKPWMPHSGNYLHIIYIVSGITNNLRWVKVYGKICKGYMQILCHFTQRTWASIGCWQRSPGTHPPWMLRDNCILQGEQNPSLVISTFFSGSSDKWNIVCFSNICVCVHSSFYMEYYSFFSSFHKRPDIYWVRSYVIICFVKTNHFTSSK